MPVSGTLGKTVRGIGCSPSRGTLPTMLFAWTCTLGQLGSHATSLGAWMIVLAPAWLAYRSGKRWALVAYVALGFAGLAHYLGPHRMALPLRCTVTVGAEAITSLPLIVFAALQPLSGGPGRFPSRQFGTAVTVSSMGGSWLACNAFFGTNLVVNSRNAHQPNRRVRMVFGCEAGRCFDAQRAWNRDRCCGQEG